PPRPAPVELRTFADEPVTFLLPSYGLDPDGDPVELVGLDGQPPSKGTVESDPIGASFTYTPLPDATGADSLRWQLRDTYDAIGYLDVRVVIGPRAVGNRPPVAVRDEAQVVTGRSVFIPVLANDTDPDPGNIITFDTDRPYDQPNEGAGEVTGTTDDGFISYQAPITEGEYSFLYYITDTDGEDPQGLSAPVQGLVTVTVTTEDKIVNRPPVVRDIVLKPAKEGEEVNVDLAAYASDPEGQPLAFRAGDDATLLGASVTGSTLTVTMTREPMIFTYLADDGSPTDFLATGVVQIPVPKNQAPSAEVLQIDVGEDEATKRIDIPTDLFSDPDGDEVRIYTASDPTISPPEASNGGDLEWDGNGFVYNRNPDYGGSAKIDYFIVDVPPASVGEPIVQPASIVLNVQKTQNTPPVVTEDQIDVISGSTSSYDLRTLVSDPDPEDAANLTISNVNWTGPSSVTLTTGGTRVTFTADIDAAAVGETVPGEVTFTVDDGREGGRVDGRLVVTVKPTDLGAPVAVDDLQPPVKQGESPTWNLLGNDPPNGTGQGSEPDYEIVSTTQPALGSVALVGRDSVKFTPTADVSGQADFQYTIEDRAGRQATATVRFSVLDRPDAPTQPTVGEQLSATAVVSFARPADNGSPIDSYEVRSSPGGTTTCTASPCTVDALANGVEHTFQVRAQNEVGWSDWSPSSSPYTPDELPGTPPIAQADWNDRSATVTWGAIPNDGSDIIDVTVRITPSTVGAIVVSGGQTGGTATFTGLTNGTGYTFTLVARNKKGDSPPSPASTAVVPAGAPSFSAAPTFIADNGFVDVSWLAANGNGDDDLSYTVKLTNETAGSTTLHPVGATLSTRLPAVNGNVYNAIVNVSNKYSVRYAPQGVDSPRSASAKAIGIPTAPGSVTASAGPGNGAVNLSWSAAGAAGGTISGYQVSTNGGPWNNVGNTTNTTFSSGLTLGTSYTFRVRALNDNRAGTPGDASASSNAASPYTPPAQPAVTCGAAGTVINCTWAARALNGPTPQTVTVSGSTSSSAASGTWSSGDIGFSQTRSITVRVCNAGTAGNNCSQNTASATTPPPPSVSISIGAKTTTAACPGGPLEGCYYLNISVSNAIGSVPVRCYGRVAGGWSLYESFTAGNGTHTACSYSYAGRAVVVAVNGTISGSDCCPVVSSGGGRSNIIDPWPTY
ncbi:MAG: Ig-like domain-containing protein, partial [Solirubrobacterales bacterium]